MSNSIEEQMQTIQDKEQLNEKLQKIYGIVDMFCDIFDTEVQDKLGTVFVSADYEDLHTAKSLIGELIGLPGYDKRIITNENVRLKLRDAYQAVSLVMENIGPEEEEFIKAMSTLLQCYYLILNYVTYNETTVSLKDAIDKVFTLCDQGIEIIEGLDVSDIPDAAYINANNETFAKRRDQLFEMLDKLRPKYDESKQE